MFDKRKLNAMAGKLMDAIEEGLDDENLRKDCRFLNFAWSFLKETGTFEQDITYEATPIVKIPNYR